MRVSRVSFRVRVESRTLKNEILGFYLKTLKCHFFLILFLEKDVFRIICRTIWVKSRTLNRTLGSLNNEILKFQEKIWSTIFFWILISEWNVCGLICRNIWVECRILNKTFRTFENATLKKKFIPISLPSQCEHFEPIRLDPISSETSSQMGWNQSATKFSIQINLNQFEFGTKFVDLIEWNNFSILRFIHISLIIVKKRNFRFSIVFF